jgi:glycogen debranching enzyme
LNTSSNFSKVHLFLSKFNKNIQKIIDASAEEILWKGCVGCHSELSSAKELQSKGCFNQAWSSAMFIELIDEVFG